MAIFGLFLYLSRPANDSLGFLPFWFRLTQSVDNPSVFPCFLWNEHEMSLFFMASQKEKKK